MQQEPGEELLAHALTVVRSRMREKGRSSLAVDMPPGTDCKSDSSMQIQAVKTRGRKGLVGSVHQRRGTAWRGSGEVYVSGGSGTDFQNCTDSTGKLRA